MYRCCVWLYGFESLNYNPNANEDDGSCISFIYGCTDPTAFNYDLGANTDDGSCVPFVYGCRSCGIKF